MPAVPRSGCDGRRFCRRAAPRGLRRLLARPASASATVVLLHLPLTLAGIAIAMGRVVQQTSSVGMPSTLQPKRWHVGRQTGAIISLFLRVRTSGWPSGRTRIDLVRPRLFPVVPLCSWSRHACPRYCLCSCVSTTFAFCLSTAVEAEIHCLSLRSKSTQTQQLSGTTRSATPRWQFSQQSSCCSG